MTPDFDLLARYAAKRDEAAFAELVQRHLDHVYSTALRLVGADAHLAEDVAQAVFTDLARKAGSLRKHSTLSGWLHTSTRFAAANVVRTEQRRRQREQTALFMSATDQAPEPDWQQIRAFLDESIGELSDPERDALMLRYFEKKPLADVGAALGVSEDAARMRVDRAIDKLRTRLATRGITSTAATLGTALAQDLVVTAPVALGARITASALANAGAGVAVSQSGVGMLSASKVAISSAVLLIIAAVGILQSKRWLTPKMVPAQSTESVAPTDSAKKTTSSITAGTGPEAPMAAGLHLSFLDAETGAPVTNPTAELKGWERGEQLLVLKVVPLEGGRCAVPFDPNCGPDFRIYAHVEGYADIHVSWEPKRGESIPDLYTVRLIRPALIHGRVVDSSGNPIAGATVGFNTERVTGAGTVTEDHSVDYLTVNTDANGYWQINRLAPEMIRHLYGSASHPDYSRFDTPNSSRDPDFAQALLDGTAVFRLPDGIVVRGTVLDEGGQPVSSAQVRVGQVGRSWSRETRADAQGNFTVRGCEAGQGLVTGEADGFAPTAQALTLEANLAPVQLTLGAGRVLRVRVLDTANRPVTGARVSLDSFPRGERSVPIPQVEFRGYTDTEGRMSWNHAPDQDLEFGVSAPGHVYLHSVRIRPDDEEHVVVLSPALVIKGTVRDSVTRELIPAFRIGIGWPEQGSDGTPQPRWSDIDRFWLKFSTGEFHHALEEMAIGGSANRGYIFRFEAEGHKSFVTRVYQPDEGEVRLDVVLEPAQDIRAIAYRPDGTPAAQAQVGLMSPGIEVCLVPGGFAGNLGHALAWLRQADGEGWFVVPDDGTIGKVLVASPDGYAESTVEELAKSRFVRLKPWSRIEGIVRRAGQPIVGGEVRLLWGSASSSLSFNTSSVRTDAEGRFVFPQVPPGSFHVLTERGPLTTGVDTENAASLIEVLPGVTTHVTVDDGASP